MRFATAQNYDCIHCGKSCQLAAPLPVHSSKVATLRGLPVVQEMDQDPIQDGEPFARIGNQGACPFHKDDRCAIHTELGATAKPFLCRLFPFLGYRTPGGVTISTEFRCSAVQQNHGRPASAHRQDLEALFESLNMPELGPGPYPVLPGLAIDWPGLERLSGHLERRLEEKGADATLDAIQIVGRFYGMSGLLSVAEVDQAVEMGPIKFLSSKDDFHETVAEAAFRLVAFSETANPEDAQAYTQALCDGQDIRSRVSGYQGPSRHVHHAAAALDLSDTATRFVRALLQRQFLVSDGTLAGRLAALHLTPMLVHWMAALSMLAAGRRQPEDADVAFAFNFLEQEFYDELEAKDPWFNPLGGALLAMCSTDLQMLLSRQS